MKLFAIVISLSILVGCFCLPLENDQKNTLEAVDVNSQGDNKVGYVRLDRSIGGLAGLLGGFGRFGGFPFGYGGYPGGFGGYPGGYGGYPGGYGGYPGGFGGGFSSASASAVSGGFGFGR